MRTLTIALAFLVAAVPLAQATLTDILQDDAGTGGDAGDTFDTATPVDTASADGAAAKHEGIVLLADDPEDWYRFSTSGEGAVALDFHAKSPTCRLPHTPLHLTPLSVALVSPDGEVVDEFEAESPCEAAGSLHVARAKAGEWRVAVRIIAPADVGGIAPPAPFDSQTRSSSPTISVDYDFSVGCEPSC